jgi:ketosteroid isomerase-like protein
MRWIALLCVAAWATVAGYDMTAAQEATPEVVPAASCVTEPVSLDELQAISATPLAATPAPAASPAAEQMPAGEPADEATTEAVTATVRELTACINAGDFLRVLALYDDDFVRTALGGQPATQQMYDQLARITAREPGQEIAILEVGEVRILEDGRAAVLVTGDDLADPGPSSTTLFYLVEVDGRWLVDEFGEDAEG